ncbi:MAG: SurA N-terminal domain-containing protein [Flavobacteriales bacterium]|jgi:hypothetical protein|nr:SurA N-terminal domain-containing protein [Flavobacteriales bacterium]
MASLESIRKKSGLLIAFIGIALLAFLLGDALGNGRSIFGGDQDLGSINGEKIDYVKFEKELKDRSQLEGPGADQDQLRQRLWDQKVTEAVLNSEYEKAGISLTDKEMASNIIGYDNKEVAPIVKQIFGIQPGQEVSNAQLSAGIERLQNENPGQWAYIQEIIRGQLLNDKLNTFVGKSMISNDAEAQVTYESQARTYSGKMVFKSYASVDPANKAVTDEDIKAYYENNKTDYEIEESRRIRYTVFEVNPSETDAMTVKAKVEKLKSESVEYNKAYDLYDTIPGFDKTDDMVGFMRTHSDIPYNPNFMARKMISPTIDEMMHEAEIGFVYGPYFEGGMYRMARLMDKRNDSIVVAVLGVEVVASESTDKEVYTKASSFAMEVQKNGFDAAIKGLQNQPSYRRAIQMTTQEIPAVGKERQIVRWAFAEKTEAGTFKRFDIGNKYVIATLEAKMPKGYASFEDIKDQLKPAAENEKAKQFLLSKLNGVTSLSAAATALGVEETDFAGVSLSSNSVGTAGYDPKAVGMVAGLAKGKTSAPIGGIGGVYIARVDEIVEPVASNELGAIKSQIENTFAPRVGYELLPAMKENANIEDNRAKFY